MKMTKFRRKLLTGICAVAVACGALYASASAASCPILTLCGDRMSGAYISCDTMYAPLRAVFEYCGYRVDWNPSTGSATVTSSNVSTEMSKQNGCVNIDGTMYAPVRTMAAVLGAYVGWNGNTCTAAIDFGVTDQDNIYCAAKMASASYTDDDVFWLARIIQAEAGGECYEGKVAVGNVILERVASDEFPNTIYGVIFDTKYAVQYEPVLNGTIYNDPDEESYQAAREALNGVQVVDNCLYFLNPVKATNHWIEANRPYVTTIDNHDFYA